MNKPRTPVRSLLPSPYPEAELDELLVELE